MRGLAKTRNYSLSKEARSAAIRQNDPSPSDLGSRQKCQTSRTNLGLLIILQGMIINVPHI
jgi:uncharacterized membrane protein YidH (DUF202 family)